MVDYSVVGKRLPRVDGLDKATGRARYGVDLALPGMLVGKVLRSIYPHAKILNIDTSKAKALPGVKGIITASDAPGRERKVNPFRQEIRVMARDKVRFIGDEIAAVAAIDEDVASEALELIKVEYELLPGVFNPEEAMRPDAPRIQEEGNIAWQYNIIRGDVDSTMRMADEIFEDEVETQSQHQCYLEPVGCLAQWDAADKLCLWLSAMDPSGIRLLLAEALNISEGRIRVIQTYCGGAFGGKISMVPLHPICALLSRKAGRPVKMVNNREEEFIASLPRVSARIRLRTGVKKDGTLLAKETEIIADNGAYIDRGPRIVAQMIITPDSMYRFRSVRAEAKVVYTNKSPVGAFQGFGNLQMLFALETHLDRIARELGLDPRELRLKNAIQVGDLSVHGWQITSCDLSNCITEATQRAGWKKSRPAKSDGYQGLGLGCAMYDCGVKRSDGFSGSVALVKIQEDGRAQVISGEAEYGQGWSNVAVQIAAEELGIPFEDVEVTAPDTDLTPYSMGPWGLRLTVSGGNAVRLAAADAREKLLKIAAEILEAEAVDLEIRDGKIQVKGAPDKSIPVALAAKEAIFRRGGSAITGQGIDEPEGVRLDPLTLYGNLSRAYAFAAQAAEVEVDPDTGRVRILKIVSAHDIGKAINPLAAEGQVDGQIALGTGYALSEAFYWDEDKLLNPDFLNYRILTSLDIPSSEIILLETPDPNTVYGAKSVGQLATMASAATLANAIYNAVGVRIKELPITPEKILKALEKGGRDAL